MPVTRITLPQRSLSRFMNCRISAGVLLVELWAGWVCVVPEVALAALCADASVSVSVRMAMTCSSSLNWASCETNCVLSVGFRGSWFCNCATSSCRNISSVGADAVAAAVVDAAPVEEDPVNALTADAIIYSLRLLAAGGAVFHLLDPTGPVRLALPPLAFLLMRPGIRL